MKRIFKYSGYGCGKNVCKKEDGTAKATSSACDQEWPVGSWSTSGVVAGIGCNVTGTTCIRNNNCLSGFCDASNCPNGLGDVSGAIGCYGTCD